MSRQFPALRGVAILLVVLNHSITMALWALQKYGYPSPAGLERYLLVALREFGLIAVPTFLFLSGCFVVYAVQGKGPRTAYKIVRAGLRHIVWPYLIWSVVFHVMIYFLLDDQFTLFEHVKHLLVGYPFNFVPLLVFYYLLAPILVPLGRQYPWPLLIAFGLYQLFVNNVLKPGLLGVAFPDWMWYFTLPGLRGTLAIWGIYFPLGVIYSLHSKRITPYLTRFRWPLASAAVVSYGLAVLHKVSLLDVPLASLVCPVAVILLFPLIKRESLPLVRSLEQMGKRAFGLYLTNLISLSIALVSIQTVAPWFYHELLLLIPVLFAFTIAAPRLLMVALERWPSPAAHRYVFG